MVGHDEQPARAKTIGRPPWTIGRVLTDLAIIMVAVPLGLNFLVPQPHIPGGCATGIDIASLTLGLIYLAGIGGLKILKALNDACERACDIYWPMTGRQGRKPKPLDDF